ncbi:hypothetical protein N9W41_00075 [bacterium]|nr:hypothetical protein [bacterium]
METVFKKEVDHVVNQLGQLDWADKSLYIKFLAQTYYYVCHSVPLLKYALKYSDNNEVSKRLEDHIKEESGHEKMVLSDLNFFNEDIKAYKESESSKKMYTYVYNSIEKNGPIAIFAYALLLEGVAKYGCPELAKSLEGLYGKKSASFIYHHGVLDQDHVEEGFDSLGMFNKKELAVFEEDLKQAAANYIDMIAELQQCHKEAAA